MVNDSDAPSVAHERRDLNHLTAEIQRLGYRREALAESDVCLNCGSRIFLFPSHPVDEWMHRSGVVWCEPQRATPMAGRVLVDPPVDAD